MKLLIFSSISNPIDVFKSFNINNICNLVEIFYCQDFINREREREGGGELIWDFNYNIMILICQTRIKFCKQVIYWKRNLNNFAIKIINDEIYYVKYYYLTWLWWKILYSGFFFFLVLYICMLYTQLYNVCILVRV